MRKLCLIVPLIMLSACGTNRCPICEGNEELVSDDFKAIATLIQNDNINVFSMTEKTDTYTVCKVFNGQKIHNIYSLSKNFTATCIGILLDQGKLQVSDTIYDLYKDEYALNDMWKNVTVENVLTQTTGIESGFLDVDNEDPKDFASKDYLSIVFNHVPTYTPGTLFVYSDSNYYLLSRIVSKISGMKYQKFLIDNVFKPLDIECYDFITDPQGNSMGATGIELSSVDVAKLGYLYLKKGMYGKTRIVSESFVNKATSKIIKADNDTYYGYSFWLDVGHNMFRGSGMNGQAFVVNLETNSVIAWTSEETDSIIDELLLEIWC